MQRWDILHWARRIGLGLAIATMACGPKGSATPPNAEPTSDASDAAFENPGGMWTPQQLATHAQTLQQLGLGYEPSALTDPTAFPLGAVVSLGGCSASFVSEQGLVITNHHCVIGALQQNSTPERNLLTDGYLAKTQAEELPAGPTARVYVTTSFSDVTSEMTNGLGAIEDPEKRYAELGKRKRELEEQCEADKPQHRCRVASYFEGAQFYRIEQLEIRDVRLVYAPHAGIGVFGGEVDNWRWPRHTGDFSFLRAYVGPDGKPADPSEANVPYQPPHHLEVATKPLRPGDFAMVAGYPGRTYRLKTAGEVRDAVQWYYPKTIERYDEEIALLTALGNERPELAIKANSRLRRRSNYRTNFEGMLDGLVQGGLAADKEKLEADLQAWIDADPERKKKWGDVLGSIEAAHAERRQHRDHDAAVQQILGASQLLEAAKTIIEAARARDVDKNADEHAENADYDPHEAAQQLAAMSRSYDPRLDRALLKLAIVRAARLPEDQRPTKLVEAFIGDASPDDNAAVDAALGRLYAKTKLGDEKTRLKLHETATSRRLSRSRDPFIVLAREVESMAADVNKRKARFEGVMATLRPVYIEALRGFTGAPIAPDANGTLRVTYGTIRGYKPKPDVEAYAPFTTLAQMVAKHTGEQPFSAPQSILAAAKSKDATAPYVDESLGDVPVNFLADLDITGGNSGSATLGAGGELIGLAFDGNYESIASDWLFMPDVTRSIHVDIRYVLWIMDAVDQADHLLLEMGVQPKVGPVAAPAQPSPTTAERGTSPAADARAAQ